MTEANHIKKLDGISPRRRSQPQRRTHMSPAKINRRNLIAGAAAVAVVPAAAASSTAPDPIFAAIETNRAAMAATDAAEIQREQLFMAGAAASLQRAAQERLDSLVEQETAAALAHTVPTTLPGVEAMLRYMAELQDAGLDFPLGDAALTRAVHQNLADALARIAAERAAE